MHEEDDLLPISGLQHLAFCERQCGLMYIEQMWQENPLTVDGEQMHERVHAIGSETSGGVCVARGLRIRSLELGLTGQADVVEFHRCEGGSEEGFARLPSRGGKWRPFPVEYKRGRPKPGACDEVQLCAQAMCLEEMLEASVPRGGIFYGEPRRRQEVQFGTELRTETERLASRLHALVASGETPPAEYSRKCRSCSLYHECLPETSGSARSAKDFLDSLLEGQEED